MSAQSDTVEKAKDSVVDMDTKEQDPQEEKEVDLLKQDQEVPPNETLFVSNLSFRIKERDLKPSLLALFSRFGAVVEIIVGKAASMKGQAWIVYNKVEHASAALRELKGFMFHERPLRVAYAKEKSDIIKKLHAIPFDHAALREKRMARSAERRERLAAKRIRIAETKGSVSVSISGSNYPEDMHAGGVGSVRNEPPNHILFVENLPTMCTAEMLCALFKQIPGFKEVRVVPGMPGIAFVEYDTVEQATIALTQLQHFKITPTDLMAISYAKAA